MAKWALIAKPELVPVVISSRRYQQILAQVAEVLYEYERSSASSKSKQLTNPSTATLKHSRTQAPPGAAHAPLTEKGSVHE